MEFSPGHKSPWSAIDSSLCQMEVKRNTKCTALLLLALQVFNISQGLPCLAPTIAITHRLCWILQTCLPSAGCGSFGRPLAQWRFPCPHVIVPSTHPTSTCNNQFVEKCCNRLKILQSIVLLSVVKSCLVLYAGPQFTNFGRFLSAELRPGIKHS